MYLVTNDSDWLSLTLILRMRRQPKPDINDPEFLASVLENLPGVDANDPSYRETIEQLKKADDEEKKVTPITITIIIIYPIPTPIIIIYPHHHYYYRNIYV